MAPLPVIADTYRVAFNWVNSDVSALVATNVMHFHKSGSSPAAVATILDTNATANMWSHAGTHSHVASLQITPLDGSSVTFPFVTGSPAKWSGTQTGNDPIPAECAIIKLLTNSRGRSFRGRVYLPWMDESARASGQISSAVKTSLNSAWIAWHTALTSAGLDFVVASYKLAQQNPVSALAAETYTATQRRRQVRTSAT